MFSSNLAEGTVVRIKSPSSGSQRKKTVNKKLSLRFDFNNPPQPLMLFPGRVFDPLKFFCCSLRGSLGQLIVTEGKHCASYEFVFYTRFMFTLMFSRCSLLYLLQPSVPCSIFCQESDSLYFLNPEHLCVFWSSIPCLQKWKSAWFTGCCSSTPRRECGSLFLWNQSNSPS